MAVYSVIAEITNKAKATPAAKAAATVPAADTDADDKVWPFDY